MDFLLDRICMPMTGIILAIVFGRFIWRIMFFRAATRVEAKIREDMFDNCRAFKAALIISTIKWVI